MANYRLKESQKYRKTKLFALKELLGGGYFPGRVRPIFRPIVCNSLIQKVHEFLDVQVISGWGYQKFFISSQNNVIGLSIVVETRQ